jgi:hypothetical protein
VHQVSSRPSCTHSASKDSIHLSQPLPGSQQITNNKMLAVKTPCALPVSSRRLTVAVRCSAAKHDASSTRRCSRDRHISSS